MEMVSGAAVVERVFKIVGLNLCVGLALIWYGTSRHVETRAEAIERNGFDAMQMAFIENCEAVQSRHHLEVARPGDDKYTRPWNQMTCVCIADEMDYPSNKAKRHVAVTAMIASFGEAESDPIKRDGIWATLVSHGRTAGLTQRESESEARGFYSDVRVCTKPRDG